MYLKFWGVRKDGEYAAKKGKPRPGWTFRGARRNEAREAHWPTLHRWRIWIRRIKDEMERRIRPGGLPA